MSILAIPFVACGLLAVIHGYFGLHVLRRGVIFLDIALAQLASLGALIGSIVGFSLGSLGGYLISASFTIVGAAIFTLTRSSARRDIPQEAIIGIVYVVAAAAAIAALSRFPGEGHHLQEMMIGNILFVWPPDLFKTTLLYAAVGLIHWLCRRSFWAVSDGDTTLKGAKWWDFAFYATFGIVVTSSVKLAGVLLVFMLLVAPAAAALLLSQRRPIQVALAWIFGTICSGVGLVAALRWDIPPGAAIIVTCGVGLLLTWGYSRMQHS
ncbi:metal ABC transporter permease [bacterium]|nr:metal ABC transporter permease [bacterium]